MKKLQRRKTQERQMSMSTIDTYRTARSVSKVTQKNLNGHS
jgi:hypothetical protein